jgi:hypothetical protein
MTIKFSVAAFAEAAKAIRNIPGGSRNIEILDHARLEVAQKKLTLTMSDLDIEACATIPCEGAATIAAIPRAVLEFFIARDGQGDDQGTLDFDAEMKTVVARQGKGRLTMPVLPGADFFLIGAGDQDWSFSDPRQRADRAAAHLRQRHGRNPPLHPGRAAACHRQPSCAPAPPMATASTPPASTRRSSRASSASATATTAASPSPTAPSRN